MILSSAGATGMIKVGLRLFPFSNPIIITNARWRRGMLTNEHRSVKKYQLDLLRRQQEELCSKQILYLQDTMVIVLQAKPADF